MVDIRAAARWGDPAAAVVLPEAVRSLLGSALGVTAPATAAQPAAPVLPGPVLPEPALAALGEACAHVRTDDAARLAHAAGKSTVDLLRLRAGDASGAPDAVACPANHPEVVAVLRACAAHRLAAVPFGGGTSVVGGLRPGRQGYAGVVAVDLARLDRLLGVDAVSRTATFQAGVRAPRAEELLAAHGFTLGHFPQSYEYATLGGFAATRSSGQASSGYGRFDQLVVGLRAATPAGTLDLGRAPASAAGPDLRQLLLGSEGAFGVITELTLQVRPAPAERRYAGWAFSSFEAGVDAVRALAQDGPLPTVLRLSDEVETAVGAATHTGPDAGGGCLAIAGFEGTAESVAASQAAAEAVLLGRGATPLGPGPGQEWVAGRFRAPYLRDALLDAGAIVETLETATFWSRLPATRTAVHDALVASLSAAGTPPLVMCHLSHVYPTGASLYFTVVAAQRAAEGPRGPQRADPVAQWLAAKTAASDAIAAAGATISHHHGVGRDHLPWYGAEIGPAGVAALRAVKAALDPSGVLNPGVLIP
ncbi:MAG TPA: FAD-binding oxidoreductase [Pilimelia sp.]|nr:FAD-binding oxidoreductase [Pilimelia sp.]